MMIRSVRLRGEPAAAEPGAPGPGLLVRHEPQEYAEEPNPGQRETIQRARRYFLCDAVYFYDHNRVAEAAKWYRYLGKEFPDKTLLERDTNSFPRNLRLTNSPSGGCRKTLAYTSQERTTADVQGLLAGLMSRWPRPG